MKTTKKSDKKPAKKVIKRPLKPDKLNKDGKQISKLGNDRRTLFTTPEARKKIYHEYCEHLAMGYSKHSFPPCDWKTIEHYMQTYQIDMPSELMEEAKRKGRHLFEKIGMSGTTGKIARFSSPTWQFIMQNKYGMTNNSHVKSDHSGSVQHHTIVEVALPDNGRMYEKKEDSK